MSGIPTPALPAHTHTAAVLSPQHFPIFTFPLPGSPKGGEFTLESNELHMDKCYSWKQQNIHSAGKRDLQGTETCRGSLSASPIPRGTSARNPQHGIIAEYCPFSFNNGSVSGRADPCPRTLPSLWKAGGTICWEQKEGQDAK